MMAFLVQGIILGLSAGVSPGPLTALVISETLNHKTAAGIKVGLAPLFTDAPIVVACFLVLTRFSHVPILLGIISVLGAAYIFRLGIKSLRLYQFTVDVNSEKEQSLLRGIITNFLSPNPYIFWITVGSLIMIKALETGKAALVLFLVGFYVCLVGTKITLAILVGMSRRFLNGRAFVIINNILGILLILFACLLLYEGIQYFLK